MLNNPHHWLFKSEVCYARLWFVIFEMNEWNTVLVLEAHKSPYKCNQACLDVMRRRFTIYSAFLDIKISISWYQEIHFLICVLYLDIKKSNFWYHEIHFLISRIRFLDIKKYFLISRIHVLISRNLFLDIKKCWINSKNGASYDAPVNNTNVISGVYMIVHRRFLFSKLVSSSLLRW